jgi:hypothetical protein
LTYEFLHFCEQKQIIPICFIPHTTHWAQPLDQKPFLVLKSYFRKENTEEAWLGNSTADKADFFRIIAKVRDQALTSRTIRHAFRDTGLYPYSPEKVIEPLRKRKEPTPELQWYDGDVTPPLASSSITYSPPATAQGVRKNIQKVENLIDCEEISPKLHQRLSQILNHYKDCGRAT